MPQPRPSANCRDRRGASWVLPAGIGSASNDYGSNKLESAGTSTACSRRAASGTILSTASLVDASTTGAATPSL